MRDVTPFLLFCQDQAGWAEEAINWYCSVFPEARLVSLERYGPGEPEPEGTVRTAVFVLGGREIRATESHGPHDFGFTPAISLWLECSSLDEIDTLAEALAERGSFLMPLDSYGWSRRFAWVADRFGVTWQLNLA